MENYVKVPGSLFELVKTSHNCKSYNLLVAYVALLAFGKQGRTRLSIKALSRHAGMSPSTAKKAVEDLQKKDLLLKAGCRRNHRNIANHYILNSINTEWYFCVPRAIFNSGLKAVDLAILITLFSFTNENGICYPSQSVIAERTGLSRCTVNRHLKDLYRLGWIDVIKRAYKTVRKETKAHFSFLYTVFDKKQKREEVTVIEKAESIIFVPLPKPNKKTSHKDSILITFLKRGVAYFRSLFKGGCSGNNQLFNTT